MAKQGPFTHDGSDWTVDDKGKVEVTIPESKQTVSKIDLAANLDRVKDRIAHLTAEIDTLAARRMMLVAKRDDLQIIHDNAKATP